mmetsp:Transcript_39970/g.96449  ORF Transcript_39970/g.96449 Transcript_39970/m.96449 type:complete len:81 (+) Transcript_39970:24-266(+)
MTILTIAKAYGIEPPPFHKFDKTTDEEFRKSQIARAQRDSNIDAWLLEPAGNSGGLSQDVQRALVTRCSEIGTTVHEIVI